MYRWSTSLFPSEFCLLHWVEIEEYFFISRMKEVTLNKIILHLWDQYIIGAGINNLLQFLLLLLTFFTCWQLDVIGIDEAQFFGDLYDFCCKAADHDGKIVVVAGLDGDYLRCFSGLSFLF